MEETKKYIFSFKKRRKSKIVVDFIFTINFLLLFIFRHSGVDTDVTIQFLGVDSVSANLMRNKIMQVFNVSVSIVLLFSSITISELANKIIDMVQDKSSNDNVATTNNSQNEAVSSTSNNNDSANNNLTVII